MHVLFWEGVRQLYGKVLKISVGYTESQTNKNQGNFQLQEKEIVKEGKYNEACNLAQL